MTGSLFSGLNRTVRLTAKTANQNGSLVLTDPTGIASKQLEACDGC